MTSTSGVVLMSDIGVKPTPPPPELIAIGQSSLTKLGQKSSASVELADGPRRNAARTQSYFLIAAGAGLPDAAIAVTAGFTRPPEEM